MDALLLTLLLCCAAVAAVNASCSEDEFQCRRRHGSGNCMPIRWVCDGDRDCLDSSDESTCGSPRNCPDGFFSCQSGRCIPDSWVCDGTNDCRDDGSDEQNCDATTPDTPASQCAEDQFACRSPRRSDGCIPMRWVCDGDRGDCYDNSDESHCGSRRPCPSDHFACDSGRCVPNGWVCDGTNDCHDSGSDERNCHASTTSTTTHTPAVLQHCPEGEFACRSHRRSSGCIPLRWVCDGDSSDCVDGSDERNCGSPRPCPTGHFSCNSGQCIPNNWVCDGGNDCNDGGSDERNCSEHPCHGDEFACQSPRRSNGCIPRSWVCDGDHGDCVDDSDERNCAEHPCPGDEFACQSPRRSRGCIPRSWVCDGDHGDCVDDSDELHCANANQTSPSPVNPAIAPAAGCSAEQFACASRRWRGGCVPLAAVCDARADCDDGSDETQCGAARACPERWFACASGRCLPPAMICDGRVQCPDAGDETHCGNPAGPVAVRLTPERGETVEEARGGAVKVELPSWLATDQDAHFALSLAPMLRARNSRDKLDAQMAVLRLFRDLARN